MKIAIYIAFITSGIALGFHAEFQVIKLNNYLKSKGLPEIKGHGKGTKIRDIITVRDQYPHCDFIFSRADTAAQYLFIGRILIFAVILFFIFFGL